MRRFKTGWTRLPDGSKVGDVVLGMGSTRVRSGSRVLTLSQARPGGGTLFQIVQEGCPVSSVGGD